MPIRRTERWILYNAGLSVIPVNDFQLSRESWVNTYNRAWHDSGGSVQESYSKLASLRLLGEDSRGRVFLTRKGQEVWSSLARPDWRHSYSWSCNDPVSPKWDYRITVSAINLSQSLAVIFDDINQCTYGVMDPTSIRIQQDVSYYPLYWKLIENGVTVSFDASELPGHLNQRKNCSIERVAQWYLGWKEVSEI